MLGSSLEGLLSLLRLGLNRYCYLKAGIEICMNSLLLAHGSGDCCPAQGFVAHAQHTGCVGRVVRLSKYGVQWMGDCWLFI